MKYNVTNALECRTHLAVEKFCFYFPNHFHTLGQTFNLIRFNEFMTSNVKYNVNLIVITLERKVGISSCSFGQLHVALGNSFITKVQMFSQLIIYTIENSIKKSNMQESPRKGQLLLLGDRYNVFITIDWCPSKREHLWG